MIIVCRSQHRWWWVPLVTLAGWMLATSCASASEMGGKGSRAIASGLARGGSVARLEDVTVRDNGRIATTVPLIEPLASHACDGSRTAAGIRRSPSRPILTPRVSHPVPNSPNAGAAVRVVSHSRVRVTRLHNGSILCCRELPSAHIMAVPWDANDDTASDGDESSDDDDSQDDQNGDDDSDSPIIAWHHAIVGPFVAPARPRELSSLILSSLPHLLTFQPLRC
jgi:hypothetical protein